MSRQTRCGLWAVGCFVGMFLNVNSGGQRNSHGTDLSQLGAGAYQADYLGRNLWHGFWYLALLNGFWILFSTHLDTRRSWSGC